MMPAQIPRTDRPTMQGPHWRFWMEATRTEFGERCFNLAMTQASKGIAEIPKTAAGRSAVKLLGPAMAALKAQKEHTSLVDEEVFRIRARSSAKAGMGRSGRPCGRRWLRRQVRYRRPYQTRHTDASMMLSAGEHPMWVAQQMWHSDWTIIARVYRRWIPQWIRRLARRLSAFSESLEKNEMPVVSEG